MINESTKIYAQEKGHCPTRNWETTFGKLTQKQQSEILKTGEADGGYWYNEKGAGGCIRYSINQFNQ